MLKLLRASFSRLLKSKVLWFGALFMFAVGILLPVSAYIEEHGQDTYIFPERLLYVFTAFVPFALAAFCSLFIGTEHSSGGFRRKFSIGSKRVWVYISNFITCVFAGLIFSLSYVVSFLVSSAILLDGYILTLKAILFLTACSVLNMIAFTAIFVLVSVLINQKTLAAVICLVFTIVIIIIGMQIDMKVNNAVYGYYELDPVTDELVFIEEVNPNAVTDNKRNIYEFFGDFLPGGQVAQLADVNVRHPLNLCMWSSVIIISMTALGVILFSRKDIK